MRGFSPKILGPDHPPPLSLRQQSTLSGLRIRLKISVQRFDRARREDEAHAVDANEAVEPSLTTSNRKASPTYRGCKK